MTTRPLCRSLIACLVFCWTLPAIAQQVSSPVDDQGRFVQFQRDIAPIFAARCLECHNEKNPKSGFRIDTADSVADYIEAGDSGSSALMTEYLLSEDPDMLMPPPSHKGPLSPAELALIGVWINQGADWPEGYVVRAAGSEEADPTAAAPQPQSWPQRLWAFQGYFHPATVHFPIALLLVGGLFVLVGVKYPVLGDHVALSCLFIGTASSIVASAMGWAFAVQRGYGSWTKVDMDSEIFWHRWSALFVTVLAIAVSFVALQAIFKGSQRLRAVWKVGLLGLAAMVGAVGHQGGEMTYGAAHYQQAFELIFGKPDQQTAIEPAGTPETAQEGTENAAETAPQETAGDAAD